MPLSALCLFQAASSEIILNRTNILPAVLRNMQAKNIRSSIISLDDTCVNREGVEKFSLIYFASCVCVCLPGLNE